MGDVRKLIRDSVEAHGAQRTARALAMSRNAVLALAAGGHVREGTLALAEQRVERLSGLGAQD